MLVQKRMPVILGILYQAAVLIQNYLSSGRREQWIWFIDKLSSKIPINKVIGIRNQFLKKR